HVVLGQRVADAQLGGEVGEIVAAIFRARVQATGSGAQGAIVARVAGDHAVVVIVVHVLQPRAHAGLESPGEGLFKLAVQCGDAAVHFIVVVLAGGADQIGGRCTIGGRAILNF